MKFKAYQNSQALCLLLGLIQFMIKERVKKNRDLKMLILGKGISNFLLRRKLHSVLHHVTPDCSNYPTNLVHCQHIGAKRITKFQRRGSRGKSKSRNWNEKRRL